MNAKQAREIVRDHDYTHLEFDEAKGYLAALEGPEVRALVEALERIANQDYRGNRSSESVIAFHALAAWRKATEGEKP